MNEWTIWKNWNSEELKEKTKKKSILIKLKQNKNLLSELQNTGNKSKIKDKNKTNNSKIVCQSSSFCIHFNWQYWYWLIDWLKNFSLSLFSYSRKIFTEWQLTCFTIIFRFFLVSNISLKKNKKSWYQLTPFILDDCRDFQQSIMMIINQKIDGVLFSHTGYSDKGK